MPSPVTVSSDDGFPHPAPGGRFSIAGEPEDTGSGVVLGHDVHSGEAVDLPDVLRPRAGSGMMRGWGMPKGMKQMPSTLTPDLTCSDEGGPGL